MNLGYCPKCIKKIDVFASRCPHCHADLNDGDDDDGIGIFGWLIIIAVSLYIILT